MGRADMTTWAGSGAVRGLGFGVGIAAAELVGPLARRLSALPETAKAQLRARLQVAVQPYQTPTGFELPAHAAARACFEVRCVTVCRDLDEAV